MVCSSPLTIHALDFFISGHDICCVLVDTGTGGGLGRLVCLPPPPLPHYPSPAVAPGHPQLTPFHSFPAWFSGPAFLLPVQHFGGCPYLPVPGFNFLCVCAGRNPQPFHQTCCVKRVSGGGSIACACSLCHCVCHCDNVSSKMTVDGCFSVSCTSLPYLPHPAPTLPTPPQFSLRKEDRHAWRGVKHLSLYYHPFQASPYHHYGPGQWHACLPACVSPHGNAAVLLHA